MTNPDRRTWLAERRAAVRAEYDDEASTYDGDEYPIPLHRAFVDRLLELTPAGGRVLDAPCGTGRWFAPIVESGRSVVGIDQSAGMLDQARRLGLAEALHQVGLQELTFFAEFEASMTIDAMENVPPEEWPVVVGNLRRAVKPGGHLYMTVEESADATVDAAFAQGTANGLPIVRGEVIEGDVAGYHFYPGRTQALAWIADADLTVLEERFDQQEGWGYRHFILRAD